MGVELNKQAALESHLARGGKLQPMPDGPYMAEFQPHELAQAVEAEVRRCTAQGWAKVTLSMDPGNAMKLAAFLRRAALVAA